MNEKQFAIYLVERIFPTAGILKQVDGRWRYENFTFQGFNTSETFSNQSEAVSRLVDYVYNQYERSEVKKAV